ncbi:hypothetical protein BDN72DRAFT_819325 [Pluteus cervinus]|uniref:Uncharacterized protein n=1 Tax=Pluteus cervinus TaxID=181527 RepID=A0ACD3AXI5_9AGAR|nr:hypothetical protein BDN72DRAFT_819325 [Pluteus cervinus]
MYRVFLGAPSKDDVDKDALSYQWRTISSKDRLPPQSDTQLRDYVLPPATLEAVNSRISLVYQNVIFDDGDPEESYALQKDFGAGEHTTLITWDPTQAEQSRVNVTGPSFLRDSVEVSGIQSQEKSLENDETQLESCNYSDASSIARFPTFHFDLHALTGLGDLEKITGKVSRKVNILLAVLEVEGPDTIRIKKGADAGKEVYILKTILGDEEGRMCKLTAWRDIAELWGGAGAAVGVKRGDVVFLEDVMANLEPGSTCSLSASPYMRSRVTICYRTLPYAHEDGQLRPDLRLGMSDPCVNKVAAVVRWFEHMAGLPAAPIS